MNDYLFTKNFCFTNLKLGSVTVIFTITKKIRKYILLCRCLFSLRWIQQLLSAEHTFRNKDISIFEKTVFNGSIFGLHTNLTEMYFNDVFLDSVKIMGEGWKLLSLRQVWGRFFFVRTDWCKLPWNRIKNFSGDFYI